MPVAADPQESPGSEAPQGLVLDTNVVLDWLWFDDPRVAHLAAAVQRGLLNWTATPAMRREFEIVLGRLPRDPARSIGQALASFDRWSKPAQVAPVFEQLRCNDGDDQKFIDLAVAAAAPWLLSRDRAVLKLARRAAAFGLAIVVPERWT
jgi:predicted nucleic acid-binding protein